MDKWIKENWFKLGILVSVFLVVISVGYYFVLYLPVKDRELKIQEAVIIDQESSKNCTEIGQKYFDENYGVYKGNDSKVILSGPFFHFNKKLDACLLEYKLMIYNEMYINNPNGDYLGTNYIENLTSGGTEAFVGYAWKNGNFKNDWDKTELERFQRNEADLMNN